jgi:hypothetical protein
MTLPERLDRMVHASRLDFMTPFGAPRPRNLRWLPALILIALPAGYTLLIWALHHAVPGGSPGWPGAVAVAGLLLYAIALVAAAFVPLFGPRVGSGAQGLDERELMLRARAGNLAGRVITLLATLGCFYCAFATFFGLWAPAGTLEWVNLGMIVSAYAAVLPVLIASWLQPAPDAED